MINIGANKKYRVWAAAFAWRYAGMGVLLGLEAPRMMGAST